MKRRLKNRRPKAPFGIDGAIQAAATIQSAIMNAAAQAQAASTQADAIASQARTQANALEQQSINNERLKTKELELTRETNNKIADSISTLNLNESMTQGKLSNEELARENRISMKRGGSVKRKRKRLSNQRLAGDDYLPFRILDGGGAIYRGQTPQGNYLYELYGNDHDHYHKAQGGKYKSGVGIKTADGTVFEGEGNQNGGVGEMLLVNRYDPSNVMALSRHQVGNINPVQSILAGMSPEEAAIRQEANKGNYNPLLEYGYAKYGGSTRRRLRRGGRCKAYDGWPPIISFDYNGNHYIIDHGQLMSNEDGVYDDEQYGFAGFNGVVPKGTFATYLTQNHKDVPNFKPLSPNDIDAAYENYNKAWANYFARPSKYAAERGLTDGYMETGIDNPIANNQNTNNQSVNNQSVNNQNISTKPWHERLRDPNDDIYSNPLVTNWIETFKNETGLDYEPNSTKLPYDIVTQLFPNEKILDTSPEWKAYQGNIANNINGDNTINEVGVIVPRKKPKPVVEETYPPNRFWETPLAGAIYNAGSQLTSAGINAIGNYIGARKLSNAYNNAARTMTNAYNSLKTIDDDKFLNEDSWHTANYTPAVRFTGYNINPQLADVDRASMNQNIAIRNNTNSGAARLARMSILNNTAQEQRSKLYADQGNREEQIKQKNLEAINRAASENMQARNQHRLTLANAKLDLAKYNNDIANERIMGAANAQSQMGINSASAKANALTSTAQGFGTALNNSAQGFSNALNTMYNHDINFLTTLGGSTSNQQAQTLMAWKRLGHYVDPTLVRNISGQLSGDIKTEFDNFFKV